jgi:hypothetical protein
MQSLHNQEKTTMPGHKLLTFVHSITSDRSTQSMQTLHNEEAVTNSQPIPQTLSNWNFLVRQLNGLCQALVSFLEVSQELKVTWKRDRRGYTYFEVYDPMTEKHHRFDSEQNVRIWLDRARH